MEDPMVSIDPLKLRAAILAKFPTIKRFVIYLAELDADKGCPDISKGLSQRNVETILSCGEIRRSALNTVAEILQSTSDHFLRAAIVPWQLPNKVWVSDFRPPGALLRADFEVVPFHFREKEMAELQEWCNPSDSGAIKLKLYTGAGGMGKTRLALELCRRKEKEGWRTGFLDFDAFKPDERRWDEHLSDPTQLLLVFDYVENHVAELIWVLRTILTRAPRRLQVRLLLLARSADDWWMNLRGERDICDLLMCDATYKHSLGHLTADPKKWAESYELAGRAFAKKLGRPFLALVMRDVGKDPLGRVLLVHMAALAHVEGVEVQGDNGILEYVLQRERRFWRDELKHQPLLTGLERGLDIFFAAVALCGGADDPQDGLTILKGLSFFHGKDNSVLEAANQLGSDCYPGQKYIEPLQPDLLKEHLEKLALKDPAVRKEVFQIVHKAMQSKKKRLPDA